MGHEAIMALSLCLAFLLAVKGSQGFKPNCSPGWWPCPGGSSSGWTASKSTEYAMGEMIAAMEEMSKTATAEVAAVKAEVMVVTVVVVEVEVITAAGANVVKDSSKMPTVIRPVPKVISSEDKR